MDTTSIRTTTEKVVAEPVKMAVCDGCGKRFPRGELSELHEDNHDNLTYFHGDSLCRECAAAAGVIR